MICFAIVTYCEIKRRLAEVLVVTCGLIQKMYKFRIKRGKYIVELLNSQIMKRSTVKQCEGERK